MHSKRSLQPYVLLLVPGVLFVAFFVLPLITLLLNSFYSYSRMSGIVEEFSLGNYRRIIFDEYYLSIVLNTIRLGAVTALVAILVGYPVALYITAATPRMRAIVILSILSPLMISVIVRSFGWVLILGPRGLIESVLSLGGISGGNFMHTDAAVVVGLVNVLLPFVVLSVATSLQSIDAAIPLAASSLGASPWRNFRHVVLPLSLPGVYSGILIAFSLASSTFVTPAVLGGAQFKVLSTTLFQQAIVLHNWPFSAALAITLVLIVLLATGLQLKIADRGR